jgi:hypothetical protein
MIYGYEGHFSGVAPVSHMPMLLNSAIQQPGGTLIEVPSNSRRSGVIHLLRSVV